MSVIISPSLLSADFGNLNNEIDMINASAADWLHIDVMDGVYVENVTFGPQLVADLKKITKLPLSVHMELVRPETFLPMFAKAGADIITFQLDACPNPLHMLREVKKAGIKAGLGIGPSYDVERLRYLLPHIDGLILMSVEPGYGGQPFEESIYEKVKRSVEIMDETGIHVPISIDGGVNTVTGKKLVEAGADILIAGSSVFGADSITDAVKSLKAL